MAQHVSKCFKPSYLAVKAFKRRPSDSYADAIADSAHLQIRKLAFNRLVYEIAAELTAEAEAEAEVKLEEEVHFEPSAIIALQV
jgi:hypothetical protein